MLYALAHPLSLAVLLASYVLGLTAHGLTQGLLADRMGDRRPRLEKRLEADPRRHVDPFGAVAAAISGLGWAHPVELLDRRRRSAVIAVALVGPAVNLLLGVGCLLALRFGYHPQGDAPEMAYYLQHGFSKGSAFAPQALLLVGASQLYLGALSLVPIPPLDGGRLLFALSPQSLNWQKARHHLVDQNIGIAVLLALLIIPLGGPLPLLPRLLDSLLSPLVNVLIGG